MVALVGIGASEHVARSAAPVWRKLGIRAFAVSATELLDAPGPVADVVVGMSESGRSAETVAALKSVSGRRIAITNFADSPLAEVVDEVIPLDSGPDSPVYTTGYTATIQAIGLLGEHWTGSSSNWSRLPDLSAQVIEDRPAGHRVGRGSVRRGSHHRRRGVRLITRNRGRRCATPA